MIKVITRYKVKILGCGIVGWQAGELITSEDCYFITNPLVRTESESYAWMNARVFIGKMGSAQAVNNEGKPSYVTYDVYQIEA